MARKKISLEWTATAEAHLEEIRAYIANDSPTNARRFITRIKRAVENLIRFPRMGEILEPNGTGELREIYVGSYRVIFRVQDNLVRIIAVIHGARKYHLFHNKDGSEE